MIRKIPLFWRFEILNRQNLKTEYKYILVLMNSTA